MSRDGKEEPSKKVRDYYRGVRGYHEAVERQASDVFVVPPELILRFVNNDALIVDVAGGSGINAKILGLSPLRYICADLSFHGLSIATENNRGSCVQSDATELPFRDGSVSTVLCSWSLEHFAEPGKAIQEMVRILAPGGRIILWGPNWDNIFRKDFPQFAHKSRSYIRKVRWEIFRRMIRNELLHFRYDPYVNLDVAAFADPVRFISDDTDAIHCVLCQETVNLIQQCGLGIVHLSDFSEMGVYLRNDAFITTVRGLLKPLLPLLRKLPLIRWFVIRFPLVARRPT